MMVAPESRPRLCGGFSATPARATLGDCTMAHERDVSVYLLPDLVPAGRLKGGVCVAIDVLRATTTIVYALAAGCEAVRPCVEVDEAKELAGGMRAGKVLLGGERQGVALNGFDLGNSPKEYTPKTCAGTT